MSDDPVGRETWLQRTCFVSSIPCERGNCLALTGTAVVLSLYDMQLRVEMEERLQAAAARSAEQEAAAAQRLAVVEAALAEARGTAEQALAQAAEHRRRAEELQAETERVGVSPGCFMGWLPWLASHALGWLQSLSSGPRHHGSARLYAIGSTR